MKTIKSLTTIAIVITLLVSMAVLVGCSNNSNGSSEDYSPGEAFAEVARRILKSDDMKLGKQMSVDCVIDIGLRNHRTNKSKHLQLVCRGNADYNETAGNGDNNFVIDLVSKDDNKKLLGIYADGEYLYLDLITEHYKIENFKLRDMILGKDTEGRSLDMESLFQVIGDLLFDSVVISHDSSEYAFSYDMLNVLESISPIIDIIGTDKLSSFAQYLGYDNWEEFASDVLGEIKGELVYTFDKKGNMTSQEWTNKGKKNSFSIAVPEMKISEGKQVIDFGNYIRKDVEWVTTKLLNIKMHGEFNVIMHDKAVGVYEWELVTNLDPLELIANKGDFNLDDDDMAHFVVKARTDKSSQEYNDSRVKAANGVILEIAYSPREFKNNNVMITFNPRAIMSKALIKEMGIPEIALNLLPEFYGTHIDVDILKELGNIGKIAQKSGVMRKYGLLDILSSVKLDKQGLTLDSNIFNYLGDDISKVMDCLFTVGDKVADKINVKVNFCKFGDRTNGRYEVSDHFLNYVNEENNESKDFGGSAGFIPAKESKPIVKDGYVEITTSTGKKINVSGGDARLSPEELSTLIGGKVRYTYTDFAGNQQSSSTPVTILGVSNVDPTIIGSEQTINLITALPDGKNLLSMLSALQIVPDIPGNVYSTKIVLTAEKSFAMTSNKELSLKVGDELKPSDMAVTAKIVYSDGSEYTCEESNFKHNIKTTKIAGKDIINSSGNYVVTYNIAGRKMDRLITIAAPDSVDIMLDSNVIGRVKESVGKQYGKIMLHYGSEIIEQTIDVSMISFPSGAVEDGKFKIAGEYHININAFGMHIKALVVVESIKL